MKGFWNFGLKHFSGVQRLSSCWEDLEEDKILREVKMMETWFVILQRKFLRVS